MKKIFFLLAVSSFGISVNSIAQNWLLAGNAAAAGNFLGTTNNQPLVFRVNNQRSGLIDFNPLKANTAFGFQAMMNNTSGTSNVAVGYQAFISNTTGYHNTAVGFNALNANVSGYYNTALGYAAMLKNVSGAGNTATGWTALAFNITGNNNTATGYGTLYNNNSGINNTATGLTALYYNTSGASNTATGLGSLTYNTTGSNNVGEGYNSLYNNTTGYSNVAVGTSALNNNNVASNVVGVGDSALFNNGLSAVNSYHATGNTALGSKTLYSNTTGYFNTATGYQALYSATTTYGNTANGYKALYNSTGGVNTGVGYVALYSNTTGYRNSAFGWQSLYLNTSGYINTATGDYALYSNTAGFGNTASGDQSLLNNTTGYNNTAVGGLALYANTIGNYNTAIGVFATTAAGNFSNATALGSNAIATASNEVFIGDGSVTAVRSATGLFTTSDGRFKKGIKKNIPGLDFINNLNPVTYNYDIHKMNDFIKPKSNADKKVTADLVKAQEVAIVGKEKILYSGFIAQEVETAAAKAGYDFSGLHKPENDKDPYAIDYASFVVPLVKAVQELSTENEELKSRLAKIEQMIGAANSTTGSDALTNIKLSDIALDQNIPNPLVTETTIRYKLPSGIKKAELVIKDMTGKTIQQITLGTNTSGVINIDASSLSSGVYTYSLVADGRAIESKRMVVAK